MLRLLITGAGSFVGESVRKYLARFPEDFLVDVLDMRTDAWKDADMRGYDSVFHVAGIAHASPKPEMEPLYRAVNRDLAIAAAEKARACGVKQFIFMSSMIVYGDAAPVGTRRAIAADTAPAPSGAYGQSKLDAENGIRALEDGRFRAAILRPPMIYGPGCRGNYNALRKFARRSPVFPAIENRRSALYIENLAEFIRQLLLSGEGGIFFPRNARVASTAEFTRCIAAAYGKRIHCIHLFDPALRLLGRKGIVRRAFGDMAYDADLPGDPQQYEVCGFEESIRRTEQNA